MFGIPSYDLESYEADDVLGTLAVQAERAGFDVFLVTGDRDAYQLVTPHVRVLSSNPRTGEPVIYDAAAIRKRWGVEPDQVVDFKGLVGDSSDNIPGVTGIGEKTASKLLQQFRDIDEIYAHLDDVPRRPPGDGSKTSATGPSCPASWRASSPICRSNSIPIGRACGKPTPRQRRRSCWSSSSAP